MKSRIEADVVVVGTGPSGVALAERLRSQRPSASIVMIERGPMLLRGHFYESGASIQERNEFWATHRICPWLGDMNQGGALLYAVGGRSLVGGAQLHRFYPADMTAWASGRWPIGPEELDPYFDLAERQLLRGTRSRGAAQDHAVDILSGLGASHPPCSEAQDSGARPDGGYPHRSAVERLLALKTREDHEAASRLEILTNLRAVRLVPDPRNPTRISRVECQSLEGNHGRIDVSGRLVVLAASPIESVRLVLLSDLESTRHSVAIGRYLGEHIYIHGMLEVSGTPALSQGPINVHVPPRSADILDRYHIEVRSMGGENGVSLVRVMGSAAMDPVPENRVELRTGQCDDLGLPLAETFLRRSQQDADRSSAMIDTARYIASRLGGNWVKQPTILAMGSSYHEAGTMRIGESCGEDRAADIFGRLLGVENLYVGDAAAFPCVGVANPILSLTAMGYRLADHLCDVLTG